MIEVKEHKEFSKWLNKLKDRTAVARIAVRIKRLSLGNFGDCKSLGKSLYELRIPYGPAYRVYFIKKDNSIILLLCGGDKSTQSSDIAKARELLKEIS